jgi:hypothetical protein
MNYLLMICGGTAREPSPERMSIEEWVEGNDGRGIRLFGRALEAPDTAATVSVRDGETLISDGPFAESKEFVVGFDVIDCDDLDVAVQVAGDHPVASFGAVEVRPFASALELSPAALQWGSTEPTDSWALFFCVDGIPASDEVEASIRDDGRAWADSLSERGSLVFGHALAGADAATTVRVDGEQTLLTDGPFVEAKEFIGGVAVLSGLTREQAIEAAATHPLASQHRVEVRRFMDW